MTTPEASTEGTLYEAEFDPRVGLYFRILVSLVLTATIVGILLIPIGLIVIAWYVPQYLRRTSARLTPNTLEITQGVFFRKEATIPLNRITDVRLHDGPIMRFCGIRGLKVETAGASGADSGSEGNLIGVVDAAAMRDAVLKQRQAVVEGRSSAPSPDAAPATDTVALLTEIRDILSRIDERGGAST